MCYQIASLIKLSLGEGVVGGWEGWGTCLLKEIMHVLSNCFPYHGYTRLGGRGQDSCMSSIILWQGRGWVAGAFQ